MKLGAETDRWDKVEGEGGQGHGIMRGDRGGVVRWGGEGRGRPKE